MNTMTADTSTSWSWGFCSRRRKWLDEIRNIVDKHRVPRQIQYARSSRFKEMI